MTKLDDMYDILGIQSYEPLPDSADEFRAILTPAIKALFLELIGEDIEVYDTDDQGVVNYKAGETHEKVELRQKVAEL